MESQKKMQGRILITGSSGYVGSHLVKYFKKFGTEVFGIDLHFPPKTLQKYFSGHIVEDIANESVVDSFLKKHRPNLVIHAAAKCLVAESVEKPELYEDFNVRRAMKFFDMCKANQIEHFQFVSSAATFGESNQPAIGEDHPQNPVNPYGQSKLVFENMLRAQSEMNFGIVRYFNVAGADPEIEIGEVHQPETHLIPNVIRAIATQEPIQVFGHDYATPDGTAVRDYIHVWDLCAFHGLLAQHMLKNKTRESYNMGLSKGFSIREVIQTAESVLGKKAIQNILPRRPGDPAVLIANSKKATANLDWHPRYTQLQDIIETAYAWYRNVN